MGFYTCFYIECILKPEYIPIVQEYIDNGLEWVVKDDPIYDCIKEWLTFLRSNGYAMCVVDGKYHTYRTYLHDSLDIEEIYYSDCIPSGLPSRWGQLCELDHNIWKFSGELKNYNSEIQYFLQHILIKMSDCISVCHLSNEDTDFVFKYTDSDIRDGGYLFC